MSRGLSQKKIESQFLAEIYEGKSSKKKVESKFLTELKHSFEYFGGFLFKIPDLPHVPGLRFDIEKPFDAVACFRGCSMVIEAKALRKYQAFGIRHLRFCQEKGLNDWVESGGLAFVFLNIRCEKMNRLLVFPWKELKEVLLKGSFLKKDLEKYPYVDSILIKGKHIFPLRKVRFE